MHSLTILSGNPIVTELAVSKSPHHKRPLYLISAALNGRYRRIAVAAPNSHARSPTRTAIGPTYHTVDIEGTMIPHGAIVAITAGIPEGNAAASFQMAGSILAGFALRKTNHSTRKILTLGPVMYPAMLTKVLREGRNDLEAAMPIPIIAPAAQIKINTLGIRRSHGMTATVNSEMLYMSLAEVVTIEKPRMTKQTGVKPPTLDARISRKTPPKLPAWYAAPHSGMTVIEPPMAAPRIIIRVNGT